MASTLGNVIKGIAGGAGSGSLLGVPGAIVGGLVGGVLGLAGKSDEEIMAQRKKDLEARINKITDERIARGTADINKQTTGNLAMSNEAAARRAMSLGHTADAESFVLPGQSQVTNQGSQAMRQFLTSAENGRSDALLSAEAGFSNRPIEPNVSDFLLPIGLEAFKFKQNNDYLDTMKQSNIDGNTLMDFQKRTQKPKNQWSF